MRNLFKKLAFTAVVSGTTLFALGSCLPLGSKWGWITWTAILNESLFS